MQATQEAPGESGRSPVEKTYPSWQDTAAFLPVAMRAHAINVARAAVADYMATNEADPERSKRAHELCTGNETVGMSAMSVFFHTPWHVLGDADMRDILAAPPAGIRRLVRDILLQIQPQSIYIMPRQDDSEDSYRDLVIKSVIAAKPRPYLIGIAPKYSNSYVTDAIRDATGLPAAFMYPCDPSNFIGNPRLQGLPIGCVGGMKSDEFISSFTRTKIKITPPSDLMRARLVKRKP